MSVPVRYEASWVPGLAHDIDVDDSLRLGLTWLAEAEHEDGRPGVVVMYAKKMTANRALLSQAASRWNFVSSRSQQPGRHGPVLAIWPPDAGVLEFAESMALDRALCVVAGNYDIAPWVRKSGASCLVQGWESVEDEPLPRDVEEELDHMLSFDGHNGFIGAGGKEDAIRALRRIALRRDRPDPQAIEDYLTGSGETSAKGATRARSWYEEILAGKSHRDHGGRIID
jgi:hypothetical protein